MQISHLRYYLMLVVFLLSVSNIAYSQSCENCGRRNIGVYDPSVLVPRPTGDDATLQQMLPRWWQLFRIGTAMRAYIRQDASSDCLFFTDMNVMRAEPGSWSWKDSLVFGTEWANTAPPGPVNTLDYLIESSVTGSEGNYVLTAKLEAAVSREVVATGNKSFTDMWNATDAAQQAAAQSFTPLFNKIRAWEEKKRDEDPEVTIGAELIKVTPEKKQIKVNEEVKVNFEFMDCDNKPLKNKKIQLVGGEAFGIKLEAPKGGHFSESYVNTDDEGKASATFVADNKPGEGVIRAYFVYKYPSGHNGIAGGEAVIQIDQAPVEYWEFRAHASNSKTYSRDTSWSGSFGGIAYNGFDEDRFVRHGSVSARGLIKNETSEPGMFWYDGNEEIVAGFASGSCSEIDMANKAEYIMGIQTGGDRRVDATSGPALADLISLQIYYDENTGDKICGMTVTCKRVGDYKGKLFDGPDWRDYGGKYDDSTSYVEGYWDAEKGSGSFKKTDTGYVAYWTYNETYQEQTYYGKANITETKTFDLTLKPFSYLTSVNEKKDVILPERTKLYQNYPNPFNPTTNIDFFVEKEGVVTLKIYDVLGKEISTLLNEYKKRGYYNVKFNASNLTSGIYFYSLKTDGFSAQKKLIILK